MFSGIMLDRGELMVDRGELISYFAYLSFYFYN